VSRELGECQLFYLKEAQHLSGLIGKITSKSLRPLLVPLFYTLGFAAIFAPSGFHLLVGSQDQLQYALNAEHLLHHQHTGDTLDQLVGRPDHWLLDSVTHELMYNQGYRKGAEIILAVVAGLTGLNSWQAFPITIAIAFLTLLSSLLFVGKQLGFSVNKQLLLQATFAVSFYFSLLHLQGSLANLLSIPLFLSVQVTGAKALSGISEQEDKYWAILTGGLAASTFVFYSDVAFVATIAPLAIYLVFKVFTNQQTVKRLTKLTFIILLVLLLGGHQSLYSTFQVTFIHMKDVVTPSGFGAEISQSAFLSALGSCLGFFTFFDNSVLNGILAQFAVNYFLFLPICYLTIISFAIIGLKRNDSPAAKTLLISIVIFLLIATATLFQQDTLRFTRTIGYLVPFLLIGIVAICVEPSLAHITHVKHDRFQISGLYILAAFFFFNYLSSSATFSHIFLYDQRSDPIVKRLNPAEATWVKFRHELTPLLNTPILIAGFEDTINPHIIASAIEPLPSYLGSDIRAFMHLGKLIPDRNVLGSYYGVRSMFPLWWTVPPPPLTGKSI